MAWRRRRWTPAALLFCTALGGWTSSTADTLSPAPLVSSDTTLVLLGGHYLDVRSGTRRANGAIVVRAGRIAALQPAGRRWQPPPGARVIDLKDRTVLPGLIDAHVHLTLAGDPDSNARATLLAGFTTVADLGSVGGASSKFASLAGQRMPSPLPTRSSSAPSRWTR